jgi:hypothetical protein
VIKTMILKERISNIIKNQLSYIVIFPIYLIIIAVVSHYLIKIKFDPYKLILSLNGGAGFIINILFPGTI